MAGREQAAVGAPELRRLIVKPSIEDAGDCGAQDRGGSHLCEVGFRCMEIGCQGHGSERYHPLPDVDDPSEEDVGKRGEPDKIHRSWWLGGNPKYGPGGCRFLVFAPPPE